jgi:molecular chaperone DnaK (HSP70)
MPSRSYVIGIDLGTSNCAVALADASLGAEAAVEDFPIPQLQRPGEIVSQLLLPSCLYVPSAHELPAGSTGLPWGESLDFIVGTFARWQGTRVPGRLVASAKSWLCHAGVNRSAAILPWGAPAEVTKLSPVEASARLLAHLAAAWNHAHPDAPLSAQEVVITVPASFDEVARALTVTAAHQAGLEKFTLVEEPQAAFYDFTARSRTALGEILKDVRLVLVVDVGGGTTDFTLIQVGLSPEGTQLRRIAVGDHLLLGGDNMDAALARLAEERLLERGRKLGAAQWGQFVQAARTAKESLLGANAPERHAIAVAAEGSRLLGGTLSVEITRESAEQIILDGFFPACSVTDAPRRGARMALQELGLPYAQDPAITRHLAAFLQQHAKTGWEALGAAASEDRLASIPRPDAVLLNGGVFNSTKSVERLMEVVSAWWPGAPRIPLLPHASLSLAVARGAAYYGLARHGIGRRISGGSAHAFYVGLAGGKAQTSPQAVCLIPLGHEEGQPVDLVSQPFKLTLGRPVQLPLFSTTLGGVDRPGDIVDVTEQFHALAPIHTLFKGSSNQPTAVPVHLRAELTELGTLELWCVSDADNKRWRLEFELRGVVANSAATVTEAMPARFAEARAGAEQVFGSKKAEREARDAKKLFRTLEDILGPRKTWRLPVLRELWSTIFAGAKRRRRSADHERSFFQLTGYCLRPGFGYPLDEWRCEQMFKVFEEGVVHHGEQPVWNEFWVMWRRASGGLDEAHQQRLWEYLKPHLARRIPLTTPNTIARPLGVQPEGLNEMVRTAASLEHLDAVEKVLLGNWIIERLTSRRDVSGPWVWALARLGTRVPIYGSAHKAVPAEQAAGWVSLLLETGLESVENAAFTAAQLARLTGDRSRDLDEDVRVRVVDALKRVSAPERWLRMVTDVVELEAAEEAQALGDTLPMGLRLH